jgi:putative methionine-R-sulfoxide reductase with GAF domain
MEKIKKYFGMGIFCSYLLAGCIPQHDSLHSQPIYENKVQEIYTFELKETERLLREKRKDIDNSDRYNAMCLLQYFKTHFRPNFLCFYKDAKGVLRVGPIGYSRIEDHYRKEEHYKPLEQVIGELDSFNYFVTFKLDKCPNFHFQVFDKYNFVAYYRLEMEQDNPLCPEPENVLSRMLKKLGCCNMTQIYDEYECEPPKIIEKDDAKDSLEKKGPVMERFFIPMEEALNSKQS